MARVVVICGGQSGEHEVSLVSARAIVDALRERHEVVTVGVTRGGAWLHSGDPLRELETHAQQLAGSHSGSGETVVETTSGGPPPFDLLGDAEVVFPVLHGPYGEDGTVQGMLELVGVPYVGSGVLASAAGMDKVTMKKIFTYHGLPQVEWLGLTRSQWEGDRDVWLRTIETSLGYPCFAKPSNLGSSVGIHKATNAAELASALDDAARFDRRLIVEAGVDAREVEVAVLGNEEPEVSVPGEVIVPDAVFYDYEAKYTAGGMELRAPAPVGKEIIAEIGRVARTAYGAIGAAGMARVDFFLEREGDRLLLNEINTIPGFTPTSVYPKLWAASGLPYEGLLDRLIELALERHGAF